MKIVTVFILALSCFLISCTKQTTNKFTLPGIYFSEKVDSSSLAGKWILVSKSGGLAGKTIIPSDTITISFDSSGNYLTELNNIPAESGTYTIGLEKTIYYDEKIPVIYFSTVQKNYFNAAALSNDSLSLSDNLYDGFSYLYTRLK